MKNVKKTNKTLFIVLFLAILGVANVNAQVTIGTNRDPHPGAILDLQSTSKGLKLPVIGIQDADVFQLSADSKDATGMIVYNNNPKIAHGQDVGIYVWDGSKWAFTGTSTGAKQDDGTTVTGSNGTYRVYCYPNGLGCWMIDNSKEGTPSETRYVEGNTKKEEGERGYYYQWKNASTSTTCPSGYHLPEEQEWSALQTYLGSSSATQEEKNHWLDPSVLAGYYLGSSTIGWGTTSMWWVASSTGTKYFSVNTLSLYGLSSNPALPTSSIYYSIRCVKPN